MLPYLLEYFNLTNSHLLLSLFIDAWQIAIRLR